MRKHVFGGREGGGEVEIAREYQHTQVRVLHQVIGQVHIRVDDRLLRGRADRLVGPLPFIADRVVHFVVGLSLAELQIPVEVVQERAGIGRRDRRRLRVILGVLLQSVERRADEACVEPADRLAL